MNTTTLAQQGLDSPWLCAVMPDGKTWAQELREQAGRLPPGSCLDWARRASVALTHVPTVLQADPPKLPQGFVASPQAWVEPLTALWEDLGADLFPLTEAPEQLSWMELLVSLGAPADKTLAGLYARHPDAPWGRWAPDTSGPEADTAWCARLAAGRQAKTLVAHLARLSPEDRAAVDAAAIWAKVDAVPVAEKLQPWLPPPLHQAQVWAQRSDLKTSQRQALWAWWEKEGAPGWDDIVAQCDKPALAQTALAAWMRQGGAIPGDAVTQILGQLMTHTAVESQVLFTSYGSEQPQIAALRSRVLSSWLAFIAAEPALVPTEEEACVLEVLGRLNTERTQGSVLEDNAPRPLMPPHAQRWIDGVPTWAHAYLARPTVTPEQALTLKTWCHLMSRHLLGDAIRYEDSKDFLMDIPPGQAVRRVDRWVALLPHPWLLAPGWTRSLWRYEREIVQGEGKSEAFQGPWSQPLGLDWLMGLMVQGASTEKPLCDVYKLCRCVNTALEEGLPLTFPDSAWKRWNALVDHWRASPTTTHQKLVESFASLTRCGAQRALETQLPVPDAPSPERPRRRM